MTSWTRFLGTTRTASRVTTTTRLSAPITPTGKLVFGALIGVILVLIRQLGGFPEGVTYAILIMNAFTPHLNKLIPKKYGWVKPDRQGGKPA